MVLGPVDRMTEAHKPFAAIKDLLNVLSGVTRLSTASTMCSAREGAPPCSGPDIAPIAPERQAATSAPVLATTRLVNVDAFMPCSAAEIQ